MNTSIFTSGNGFILIFHFASYRCFRKKNHFLALYKWEDICWLLQWRECLSRWLRSAVYFRERKVILQCPSLLQKKIRDLISLYKLVSTKSCFVQKGRGRLRKNRVQGNVIRRDFGLACKWDRKLAWCSVAPRLYKDTQS